MNYLKKTPRRKVRDAIGDLINTHKFFGVLALRMAFSPGDVRDIAGDGINFTYSEDWVGKDASADELKGAIAHIVFACALKHHLRRGDRDYGKWQLASRVTTHEILKAEKLWVPGLPMQAWGLEHLPVEEVYRRLEDDKEQDDDSENETGGGDGEGGGQGETGGDQGQPKFGPGEVQDAPADQRESQERSWDRAPKQAAQAAKAVGSDPGKIIELFDGAHDHLREWQDLLREYMRHSAPTDYTWSVPDRRFAASGLYLPSLDGVGMGPVVIAIDTSGSVDDLHVNQAVSEIVGIARDCEPESVHIVQCDADVQDYLQCDPWSVPDGIDIRGRGGTRFQPVFDFVEDQGIQPDCLIYLTDLMGPEPDDPGYPVIWGVETAAQAAQAPFGQTVVVPVQGERA